MGVVEVEKRRQTCTALVILGLRPGFFQKKKKKGAFLLLRDLLECNKTKAKEQWLSLHC
jgi:hypothetical protein